MRLALVLVHNKGAKNNAQIDIIASLITKVITTFDLYDEFGEKKGTSEKYHYELKDLPFPHEIKFYQVIPFGVSPPENLYVIDSAKVFYNEIDKTGDHPRFFNWGLKRGTDYGADIVIHLEDYQIFDVDNLAIQLNSLIDPQDKHEYVDDVSVKIASLTLLKNVGQLDETKSKKQAILDLKEKVKAGGFKIG